MKDATGELSMTAVAVVAIAAIGVVFTTLIWPQIRQNILRSTYCSQAFNCDCSSGNMCTCNYCKNDKSSQDKETTECTGANVGTIQCPNNGQN